MVSLLIMTQPSVRQNLAVKHISNVTEIPFLKHPAISRTVAYAQGVYRFKSPIKNKIFFFRTEIARAVERLIFLIALIARLIMLIAR